MSTISTAKELTQSLLGFFFSNGGNFKENCLCAQSCFNVFLQRVDFRSHHVTIPVGFFEGPLWAAGGNYWHKSGYGWTNHFQDLQCNPSIYEKFKQLSPGSHAVLFFFCPQGKTQAWLNWDDYHICVFELLPRLMCNKSLFVFPLFRIFLALLAVVMNTDMWSAEEQWRSQRNPGLM